LGVAVFGQRFGDSVWLFSISVYNRGKYPKTANHDVSERGRGSGLVNELDPATIQDDKAFFLYFWPHFNQGSREFELEIFHIAITIISNIEPVISRIHPEP
jgi:hypothetical protein